MVRYGTVRVSGVMCTMVVFSNVVTSEFEAHCVRLREAARARQEAVRLRAAVDDTSEAVAVDIRDTLGVRQPHDKWEGCTNLRTLRTLLSIVDDRGFERSPHQAIRSLSKAATSSSGRTANTARPRPVRADGISLVVRALRLARHLQEGLGDGAAGDNAA